MPIDDTRIGDGEAIWRHNLSLMAEAGVPLLRDKLRPNMVWYAARARRRCWG